MQSAVGLRYFRSATRPVNEIFRNLTVRTLSGASDLLRVEDNVTYLAGNLQIGDDHWGVGGSNPANTVYILKELSGAYTPGASLVDEFIAELNLNPSNDWDAGVVTGVARNSSGAGAASMRALAGQLIKYSGVAASDSEALEIGIHNAKSVVSHADNASVYDKFYGVNGILLLSYGGTVETTGGSAVRSNTAIVIGSIGGTNSGFKQAIVYYDTDQSTKLWQVDQQGNHLSGGGGNNAAAVAYGGGTDITTGMFFGSSVVALSARAIEVARGYSLSASHATFQITAGLTLAGILSPTQIAANTPNYNPTGLATATLLRLSTDASRDLSGILAQANGTVLWLCNVGAFNIVLKHDVTSTAANRFLCPNSVDLTLLPNMALPIIYDGVSTRWRALAGYVS